jgi:hypothetical protein
MQTLKGEQQPNYEPSPPNYFETSTLDERIAEFNRITRLYPAKHPIIVIRDDNTNATPLIDKCKYAVMKDMTFGQFCTILRARLKLPPETALFYFVGPYKKCVHHSQTIGELAKEYSNPDDGLLVVYYRGESAFGCI